MVANKFNKLNRFEIDRAIMEFPRISCYKCDIFQFHNFLEMKPISWYLSLWVLSLSCQVEKSHLTHNFIWMEECSFSFPWLSATDLQRASGAIMAYHPAQHSTFGITGPHHNTPVEGIGENWFYRLNKEKVSLDMCFCWDWHRKWIMEIESAYRMIARYLLFSDSYLYARHLWGTRERLSSS